MEASLADACRLNKMATVAAYVSTSAASSNSSCKLGHRARRNPRNGHSMSGPLCQGFGAVVLIESGLIHKQGTISAKGCCHCQGVVLAIPGRIARLWEVG